MFRHSQQAPLIPPAFDVEPRATVMAAVIYLWFPSCGEVVSQAEERCRAYAKRFSWDVVATMADDSGPNTELARRESVTRFGRPGLADALTLVRTHEAAVLLTASPAMLGGTQLVCDAVHVCVEKSGGFVQIVPPAER